MNSLIHQSLVYNNYLVISVSNDGYISNFSYWEDADITLIFFNKWIIQAFLRALALHFYANINNSHTFSLQIYFLILFSINVFNPSIKY